MRGRGARQEGYTLVEALVVMLIIGLVAVVTLPNMQRARIRANMLEVVRTFEQAAAVSRITAIKRGNNVCLSILDGPDRHQITGFEAWIETVAENEIRDSGEELVGSWQIRRATVWSFENVADADKSLYILDKTGGGTERGIVYFPTGMANTNDANRQAGVGQGAFDYFMYEDGRRWNTFRVTIFAGAGTVQVRMQVPGTSTWDTNFAHWERY